MPIYKQALTRVNVSLDPASIAFYKRHGASLSDGIRQYRRGALNDVFALMDKIVDSDEMDGWEAFIQLRERLEKMLL